MKNKIIIPAVVAVVLAVAAVVAFVLTKPEKPLPVQPTSAPAAEVEYSYENSVYGTSQSLKKLASQGEIYLPTDIGGVYYTADLQGNIRFYEYSNGAMLASSLAVNKVSVNIKASRETIPVTVSYVVKDGKTCGYGVFTSDMSDSVKIYPYAFVKLTDKPASYGEGLLLLADFNKDNFYNPQKIYSEIYDFNLTNGKASTYVSHKTRLVNENGFFREDWSMLTDAFIANMGSGKYFLSSRYHSGNGADREADVMVLSGADYPEIVAEGILGMWFVNDDKGMHYLRKSDSGFESVLNQGGKESVAVSFNGDFYTDYLISGNFLLNKQTCVLTNLITGETVTLEKVDLYEADRFSISPDGKKAVIAFDGKANKNGAVIQTLVYLTIDGSVAAAVFSEPLLFSESSGFVWLDNSSVMSCRASSGSGEGIASVVYTF